MVVQITQLFKKININKLTLRLQWLILLTCVFVEMIHLNFVKTELEEF